MKKIFYFISALAVALGTVGCADEVVNEEPAVGVQPNTGKQTTIVANTESNGSTRASLSGDDASGYEVLWSEGDKIRALSTDEMHQYDLTIAEGVGTTQGVFRTDGSMANGDYKLYYGTEGSSLSRMQQYQGEGVISNAPMFATMSVTGGNTSPVQFKNLCGLLRLTLKGTYTVKKITVEADEALSGQISVQGDGNISFPRNSYSDVSLDCGEGVKLSPEGTDFYMAMPPNTYHEVSITIEDVDGDQCVKTLKSGKTLDITRAMITPASFTVTIDKPLTWDSPVGARGVLDGRECVVVDLGGNAGKLAVATMNVGASTPTQKGTEMTWQDAVNQQNSDAWGAGWRMPSKDELEAFPEYSTTVTSSSLSMHIVDGVDLVFPLNGVDGGKKYSGNAVVWGRDILSGDWNIPTLMVDGKYYISKEVTKTSKTCVRPVHRLPITKNTPSGAIGWIDGHEGVVYVLHNKQKVVVSTTNIGANHMTYHYEDDKVKYDCYGDFITYQNVSNYTVNGWYLPSATEMRNLLKKAWSYDTTRGFVYTSATGETECVLSYPSDASNLVVPCKDDNHPAQGYNVVSQSAYWTSTEAENGEMQVCRWMVLKMGDYNTNIAVVENQTVPKTEAIPARLFHAMPK